MFATPTMEPLALRLSLSGLSGSGKTYSALSLATALGGRIAVIDTERGSAKRYHRPRGPFEFQVVELDECRPQRYVEAIHAAAQARFDVLVVDSMSHAWDGLLDQVGGGGKQGWGKVRPVEREFWDALLCYPGHLIATFRVRSAYAEVDDGKGKAKQQKVGLEAVQRQGTEYEFDICLRLEDEGETCVVEKTRCSTITGKRFSRPGKQVVDLIRPWLEAGQRAAPPAAAAQPSPVRAERDAEAEFAKALLAEALLAEIDARLPKLSPEDREKAVLFASDRQSDTAALRQLLTRIDAKLAPVPPADPTPASTASGAASTASGAASATPPTSSAPTSPPASSSAPPSGSPPSAAGGAPSPSATPAPSSSTPAIAPPARDPAPAQVAPKPVPMKRPAPAARS